MAQTNRPEPGPTIEPAVTLFSIAHQMTHHRRDMTVLLVICDYHIPFHIQKDHPISLKVEDFIVVCSVSILVMIALLIANISYFLIANLPMIMLTVITISLVFGKEIMSRYS